MRFATAALLALIALSVPAHASATDIILYASDAAIVRGNWTAAGSSGAAGGRSLVSADRGWSKTDSALAAPADYFDVTFDAPAAVTYRVWLRMRAAGNLKWNDAVWVQFSDSLSLAGTPIYRVDTTAALLVNLERCSACGVSGWGWQNTASWLTQATEVRFASSGQHTIRIQTREDGVEIDQIVLSPVSYAATAPGASTDDVTILPRTSLLKPFHGAPVALPGTVHAAEFDHGGASVAFFDSTAGNAGTVFRATDVDLQAASAGGYNVGWTIAGEWLKYSVDVAAGGAYHVQVRVATTAPTSLDITIGAVSVRAAVPNTGGWQVWTTVAVPITLVAGPQVMTVAFPSGGVNLRAITVALPAPPPPPPPPPGGTLRMMTWNVHHGKDRNKVLSVPAQAALIAQQNAHVVVLQEVQTWDQNQPAMFETELETRTGVNWTRVWAPVTNRTGTEGNLVLTTLPVTKTTTFQMHATSDWNAIGPNRSVAHATVTVGGVAVDVFSTHLDYANTSYRTAQLIDMMAWVAGFGAKRIVGGDFNSTPGTYWINEMTADYYDTWKEVTGSASGGGTINGVRFDYLFWSKVAGDTIRASAVRVLSTTLSDHALVIADYVVTP